MLRMIYTNTKKLNKITYTLMGTKIILSKNLINLLRTNLIFN